jgi:uncharacterized membrane protein
MADAPGVETSVTRLLRGNRTPGGIAMYRSTSVDFWSELDADVLRCLEERQGEMTPAEIGRDLGISEDAVCSIVGMLAEGGKVRICSVERIV